MVVPSNKHRSYYSANLHEKNLLLMPWTIMDSVERNYCKISMFESNLEERFFDRKSNWTIFRANLIEQFLKTIWLSCKMCGKTWKKPWLIVSQTSWQESMQAMKCLSIQLIDIESIDVSIYLSISLSLSVFVVVLLLLYHLLKVKWKNERVVWMKKKRCLASIKDVYSKKTRNLFRYKGKECWPDQCTNIHKQNSREKRKSTQWQQFHANDLLPMLQRNEIKIC